MNRFIWVTIFCIAVGCTRTTSDSSILPKEQMTHVLWDMIQVDELATLRLIKDTTKDVRTERIQLYQKVFTLHKTTEKQFSRSFKYYMNHPDVMKVMFDTLEARGARERKISYMSRDSTAK